MTRLITAERARNFAAFVFIVSAWFFITWVDEKSGKAEKRLSAEATACGGENTDFKELPNGRIQCFTKRGAKTITAKVEQ